MVRLLRVAAPLAAAVCLVGCSGSGSAVEEPDGGAGEAGGTAGSAGGGSAGGGTPEGAAAGKDTGPEGPGGGGTAGKDAGAGGGGNEASPPDAPDGTVPDAGGEPAPPDGAPPDATGDAAPPADLDGDGIDDAAEAAWAAAYFPYFSIDPADKCKTHGVLYRVTKHPKDTKKIQIWYDVLYDTDCGLNGHAGDDETFGALVDPAKPAPAGLLAVRAVSHQGTPCEKTTTCGTCGGMEKCEIAKKGGQDFPVVYASVDKHGGYVKKSVCDGNFICDWGGCALAPQADAPPFVNAGEPGKPLVTNLTTQGFITAQNGWTSKDLYDFDPWGKKDFGSAGNVAGDLTDAAFVVDPGSCPP